MHIPDDPLYYEKFYFTPGDLGFKALQTTAGTIGTLVCWDQWYPEGARITALRGAETLFFPTAIGWHPSEKAEFGQAQYDAWQITQRAHAISNGVWVCAVNRVGHEEGDVLLNGELLKGPEGAGLEFWGGSFIADPFGRIVAQGSHDQEEILYAELDSQLVETTRQHWPFLRDRRIDAYDGVRQEVPGRMTNPTAASPHSLGYRMPAEWEPHAATWIAWPHNAEDWPGKFQPIPWVYSEIVRHLSQVEDVNILVNDARPEKRARTRPLRAGANLARLHFHPLAHGPHLAPRLRPHLRTGTQRRAVALTDWKFNAWAKYPNWHNDDLIPQHVAALQAMPSVPADCRWSTARSPRRA